MTNEPTSAATKATPSIAHDSTETTPQADLAITHRASVGENPSPIGSPFRSQTLPASDMVADNTIAANSQTLAQLIAEFRKPRPLRSAALEPYRDVLLAERRAGASIGAMAVSLAQIGVNVSQETLRVWLLDQDMPKRRRRRRKAKIMTNAATVAQSRAAPTPATATSPTATTSTAVSNFVRPTYPPGKGPKIARDDF